jgi:ATP-dependent exoDNAse (exonuclease V) alpha subunit
MAWARDRSTLWNTAERAEHRRDSRVAREFTVALPFELNPAQRTQLARTFSQELADRYGVAVDLAIHEPRAGGDPRNYHAHLLATTREVTPEGLGAKAGLDMSGSRRQASGLASGLKELVAVRERWATLTNESLRQAHVGARVDHRSLAQQGIDREPSVRIPFAAFQMEKRGVYSEVAERLRERYRARVQARLVRGAERLRQARAQGIAPGSNEARNLEPGDLEEVRRQARQAWLRLRSAQEDRSVGEGKPSTRQADSHVGKQPLTGAGRAGPDDDFAL